MLTNSITGFGIILGVLANVLLASYSFLTKIVVTENNVLGITLIQNLAQFSGILPFFVYSRHAILPVRTEVPVILVLMVSNAAYHLLTPIALLYVPAADVACITSSTPIFTSLIAPCVLNERFKKSILVNSVLAVIGVTLLSEPSFIFRGSTTWGNRCLGYVLSVAILVANTAMGIALNKIVLTRTLTSSVLICFSNIFVAAVLVVYLRGSGSDFPRCWDYSILTIVSAISCLLATWLYVVSYKHESATILAVIETIETPIVLAMEMVFLGSRPSWNTYVGMAIITVTVISCAIQKHGETETSINIPASLVTRKQISYHALVANTDK